jgi:hypothetical protein
VSYYSLNITRAIIGVTIGTKVTIVVSNDTLFIGTVFLVFRTLLLGLVTLFIVVVK